jgi:hypothetical protein
MNSRKKLKILCVSALAVTLVGVAAAEARTGALTLSLNRFALHLLQSREKVSAAAEHGIFSEHSAATIIRPPFIPQPRSPYKPPGRMPPTT